MAWVKLLGVHGKGRVGAELEHAAGNVQGARYGAVHFAFGREDAHEIEEEWRRHGPRIPLVVDDATYRDVGSPLLEYLRDLTAEEGTEVLVLMPELFVRGWRRLLHNQKALYVKRLLLFEPDVILASVPYQLLR